MAATDLQATVTHDAEGTLVQLSGIIDESAGDALQAVQGQVTGALRLNVGGVRSVNSFGVGQLMRFLEQTSRAHRVTFEDCSETFVDLFQMMGLSAYGKITSFYASYSCDTCPIRESRRIVVSRHLRLDPRTNSVEAASFPCSCGGTLLQDDALDFAADYL
ncbi:MAG: hypothetical protein HYV63_27800 [Candidatus Schekmanbacteria bacterium]|nr:hypothetical protein [Candidatus Schekmanbacteria bacterium]